MKMTDKQYQKRILFLNHIKENYIPLKGFQLIFYFQGYEISTIKSEYVTTNQMFYKYKNSRRTEESGYLILAYGKRGNKVIVLNDKYLRVIYDLTQKSTILNELKDEIEIDIERLKAEIAALVLLLKTK
jgi:hypothetical protein